MSELLDAALDYAAKGWHVFPVEPRGKRPLTRHGHKDATTDAPTLRKWWRRWRDANIGLSLRASGLIAIDVDPRNGGDETLAALEAKHGELPRQCHQRSPNGEHIVMLDPGGALRGVLPSGIDVKADGYVVVAPSVVKDGRYEWLSDDSPPPVPKTWVKVLRRPKKAERRAGADAWASSVGNFNAAATKRLRDELAKVGKEDGNNQTHRAACLIFHDFGRSIDEGWPLLAKWNRRRHEPHDEQELRRRVERSAKAKAGVGGRGLACGRVKVKVPPRVPQPDGTFGAELERALADIEAALRSAESERTPVPLGEPAYNLFLRPYPPTQWLVEGLITQGGVAVIATEPKSTKTWSATEIALAVASDTPAFGEFAVEHGGVFYFFAEDGALQVRNRTRALAAGRGLKPEEALECLHAQPRGRYLDLTRNEDLALLLASCRRIPNLRLVVLDPLRDIHSAAEDKSDDMAPVMRRLRLLADLLGCTVLIVHHTSKLNGENTKRRPGQNMRGSGAIHGSIDSGIYLSSLRGDGVAVYTNRVDSEVKGARSAGRFDLTLRVEDDESGAATHASWVVARGATSAPATDPKREDRRKQIRDSLRAAHVPLSKNNIHRRDNKTYVKGAKGEVISEIDAMVVDGELENVGDKFRLRRAS